MLLTKTLISTLESKRGTNNIIIFIFEVKTMTSSKLPNLKISVVATKTLKFTYELKSEAHSSDPLFF